MFGVCLLLGDTVLTTCQSPTTGGGVLLRRFILPLKSDPDLAHKRLAFCARFEFGFT